MGTATTSPNAQRLRAAVGDTVIKGAESGTITAIIPADPRYVTVLWESGWSSLDHVDTLLLHRRDLRSPRAFAGYLASENDWNLPRGLAAVRVMLSSERLPLEESRTEAAWIALAHRYFASTDHVLLGA